MLILEAAQTVPSLDDKTQGGEGKQNVAGHPENS